MYTSLSIGRFLFSDEAVFLVSSRASITSDYRLYSTLSHQVLTPVDRHSKPKAPVQRNKRERKSTRIGLIERLLPKLRVRSSGVPKYTTKTSCQLNNKPSPRGLNFNFIVRILRDPGRFFTSQGLAIFLQSRAALPYIHIPDAGSIHTCNPTHPSIGGVPDQEVSRS